MKIVRCVDPQPDRCIIGVDGSGKCPIKNLTVGHGRWFTVFSSLSSDKAYLNFYAIAITCGGFYKWCGVNRPLCSPDWQNHPNF